MENHVIKPIAHMHSDFSSKFGIPRQAGLVEQLESLVVMEPEYRDPEAFRGLEQFSHVWLIWQFSQAVRQGWSPTVRPPRLGGNARMGVFATRSPFRPNSLGLSCLRLIGIEKHPKFGPVLRLAGADLMDGTPIYDIKPYVPYADCRPQASEGFAPEPQPELKPEILPRALENIPAEKLPAVRAILANDPRPRYQNDSGRVYGMEFAGLELKFSVEGDVITLHSAEKIKAE